MKLHNIITEKLSSIAYYHVSLNELYTILKRNAIDTKPVFKDNKKYYYIDAVNTKDFNSEVIIRLDGDMLNELIKADGSDYFINNKNNISGKVYTFKPTIANASSFIDEIYIMVKDKNSPLFSKIIELCKFKSIPIQAFDKKSDLISNYRHNSIKIS